MRKINEIFYSLQGEGYHTGTASVFVRFSGCNLKCSFCDTQHEDGVMMSDDDILASISERSGGRKVHVVLTGGEPSLWIDEEFVSKLKSEGYYVQIETNGTHELPKSIDWVTCSPKYSPVVLKKVDEVKIVFENEASPNKADGISADNYFLQPMSGTNTNEVIDYIKRNPKWRLSLQTHKLVGIE